MNHLIRLSQLICLLTLLRAEYTQAATVTFDTLVTGQTSFGFDGDGDSINDVIFSTTDPNGFNTIGPGVNQSFIHEPGLEGTSLLNPDLQVDFVNGAVGSISFGFALNSSSAGPAYFANFELFDASNVSLGNVTVTGAYTTTPLGQSSFPEGQVVLSFSGIASYGLFNLESEFGRLIIDDVQGTFGSTESVPEPASGMLLAGGVAALWASRRWRS